MLKLKHFNADLHIHTCLSPCADLTSSPKRVIKKALEKNLNIVGICDHHSAENVQAALNVGLKNGITVLPGMVHLIALFDKTSIVLNLQETVYKNLQPGSNDEKLFGKQIIANERDEVVGYNKRLLIGATKLSLKQWVKKIHDLDGLAIAAHIDRESYSVIGQLGFIPEDLELDAVEISANINKKNAIKRFPEIIKFPIISSSDAHFLNDIGKKSTTFSLEKPSIDEIKKALKKTDGRRIPCGRCTFEFR